MPESTATYSLRPATPDDAEYLYALHVATMKEYVVQTWGGPWDDGFQRDYFFRGFQPTAIQIILLDGRDAGQLRLRKTENEFWVDLIEVAPDSQGRGVGTAVIHDILAEANRA